MSLCLAAIRDVELWFRGSHQAGTAILGSCVAKAQGPLNRWVSNSGKEKTHKHKQICGIVPGLGGYQKFVYVFFRVIPYGAEKTHKQNSPQNPGTIPWKFCLRVFSLCVFSLPTNGGNFLLTVGAFLLTVKLLCLQSLKVLIRRTFPL